MNKRDLRVGSPTFVYGRLSLAGLAAGVCAAPAFAAGTLAGTNIANTATATYEQAGGSETSITSNTVSLTVDELLDVSVASADPGDVPTSAGASAQVLSFTVTNAGNGGEAFSLSTEHAIGGNDFNAGITAIVLDSNANDAYDAGIDTVYVAGSNDPVLEPDASMAVFVLSTIPAAAQNGHHARVRLGAAAKTGSGTPGEAFAAKGQGGGNAIVGATGADALASGRYAVSRASVDFVKSATVADPFGGTSQVPGGTITYTLVATVDGSGTLANLRIADPVPAGTTYKPGTITLDGAALSDASDGDAGSFTGTGIAVGLGDVAAGASHSITFQVKID